MPARIPGRARLSFFGPDSIFSLGYSPGFNVFLPVFTVAFRSFCGAFATRAPRKWSYGSGKKSGIFTESFWNVLGYLLFKCKLVPDLFPPQPSDDTGYDVVSPCAYPAPQVTHGLYVNMLISVFWSKIPLITPFRRSALGRCRPFCILFTKVQISSRLHLFCDCQPALQSSSYYTLCTKVIRLLIKYAVHGKGL